MPERPWGAPAGAPTTGDDDDAADDGATPPTLWFLREPDALVRRLVVRTLLEPPPGMRRLRPRWLKR
jgi:hypothetical protein